MCVCVFLYSVGSAWIGRCKSKLATAWRAAFMGEECFCLVYKDELLNTRTRPTIIVSRIFRRTSRQENGNKSQTLLSYL